jgi:hypothetical protein
MYSQIKNAFAVVSFLILILNFPLYAKLPEPIDIPHGPAGIEAPGIKATIEMTGTVESDAPQISAISDVTFPDETLVITGDDLENAELIIWSDGNIEKVKPLKTATDRMVAVVPGKLPVAAMLIWPVKQGKYGNPIRINGAIAWWVWPTEMYSSEEKQKIRITGKNIKLKQGLPGVYLKGPGFEGFIDVDISEPYHIQAEVPANLKTGKYNVWVHNSTGGKYGWSEPVTFTVKQKPYKKELDLFEVDDFGAIANDKIDDRYISCQQTGHSKWQ